MKNNLFILLIIMFFGFFSFSQNPNITIDGNGIVSCPPGLTALADFNDIGGKRIYVVDSDAISSILSTGSFSVGATTVTPTDLSCVCTTQITSMEDMFKDKATFIEINKGKGLIFSPTLFHGNILNKTSSTRISINCRFKNIFTHEAVSGERRLGSFYKILNISEVTKLGLSYRDDLIKF